MEFNQKLQELRKQKGLTQEELAAKIYVSRTAVSKWESGRGFPSIESLKVIAQFFSVTVDELLSSREMLTLAEDNQRQTEKHFRDLVFGLVDILAALLLFLPLFAMKTDGYIKEVSLIMLGGIKLYLKTSYFVVVTGLIILGIMTLILQNFKVTAWTKSKTKISVALGTVSVMLFMISSQPYAAVFAFSLLAIKAIVLIKRK